MLFVGPLLVAPLVNQAGQLIVTLIRLDTLSTRCGRDSEGVANPSLLRGTNLRSLVYSSARG